MSLTTTTDVFCDICGEWTNGVTGKNNAATRARKVAFSKGWRRVTHGEVGLIDVCPLCYEDPKRVGTFIVDQPRIPTSVFDGAESVSIHDLSKLLGARSR